MSSISGPVLVVEDHDDTRAMVELFLQNDGYRVCTAAHGIEALECIAREPPCLILLDLTMPVMDGVMFASRLRNLPDPDVAQTPVILLTAISDPVEAIRAIGAVAYIGKPISFERMIATVEQYCPPRP